jgi:hypothetical protein
MDNNPRKPGLNRLVVSGGKRVEPRLMMAHPQRTRLARRQLIGELLACLLIGFTLAVIFMASR